MIYAAHFAVVAALTVGLARVLLEARWTWHAPSLGILAWQALGLAWCLSVTGMVLAAGLAPYRLGVAPGLARLATEAAGGAVTLRTAHLAAVAAGLGLSAWLLATLGTCMLETAQTRRRHRALLALVGESDPDVPGALVLDHPAAAAYCLPGGEAQVVVSAGTLRLLDSSQLAAVLAHEHAHLRERHDLVLLPFVALRRALPRARWVGRVVAAVSLLVEMRADDRALRQHQLQSLMSALLRFWSSPRACAPPGTLGVADEVTTRVLRLAPRRSLPAPAWPGVLALAALLVGTPLSLYALPL